MTHYRAQPEDDAVLIVLCAVRDGQFGKSTLNEVIDLWVSGQIGRTDSIPGAVARGDWFRQAWANANGCSIEGAERAYERLGDIMAKTGGSTTDVIERNEAIRRAADTIWPLGGLSTDEAREELLRDIERAIETYLDATGLRGAVEACLAQWAVAHDVKCGCENPDTAGCDWPVPIPHTQDALDAALGRA
jgi:hypothetical protein